MRMIVIPMLLFLLAGAACAQIPSGITIIDSSIDGEGVNLTVDTEGNVREMQGRNAKGFRDWGSDKVWTFKERLQIVDVSTPTLATLTFDPARDREWIFQGDAGAFLVTVRNQDPFSTAPQWNFVMKVMQDPDYLVSIKPVSNFPFGAPDPISSMTLALQQPQNPYMNESLPEGTRIMTKVGCYMRTRLPTEGPTMAIPPGSVGTITGELIYGRYYRVDWDWEGADPTPTWFGEGWCSKYDLWPVPPPEG